MYLRMNCLHLSVKRGLAGKVKTQVRLGVSGPSLSADKPSSVEAALVDQVLTDATFDWAQALD